MTAAAPHNDAESQGVQRALQRLGRHDPPELVQEKLARVRAKWEVLKLFNWRQAWAMTQAQLAWYREMERRGEI